MAEKKHRILVGAPISDMYRYCLEEFLTAIKSFSYDNYDILLIDNSEKDELYRELLERGFNVKKIPYHKKTRERVVRAHNLLREYALKQGYDYLLNLDQDVIPQSDAINKLLSHNKQIVMGLYFGHHFVEQLNKNEVMPFAWQFKNKNQGHWGDVRYLNPDEFWSEKLLKIAFTGAGCMFIHKDVLKKIKFRYEDKYDVWDDRWFGYDAYKKGFEVFLDTSVKCRHLYLNRPFDWQKIMKDRERY